jgi:hypothetical protein
MDTVVESQFVCSVCQTNGKTTVLQKKNDKLECPKCGTTWFIDGESPLGRYHETWKDLSSFLFCVLRPELPSNVFLELGLKELLQDCYQTLLIGRYNASIVMMGVFLEALMKERIRLKTGVDFKEPYAKCVDKLMGIKRNKGRIETLSHGSLIEMQAVIFLDRFREKRNMYQHFNEAEVVKQQIHEAYEIPFENAAQFVASLDETIKQINEGNRKPMLLSAAHPALRSMSKLQVDRKTAFELYNNVYDFTLEFIFKYLRQKDYDEHNRQFPKPFVDLSTKLGK